MIHIPKEVWEDAYGAGREAHTSKEVGMRLIWSKEEALPWLQTEEVQEEDTEAANISRELSVEAKNKGGLLGG